MLLKNLVALRMGFVYEEGGWYSELEYRLLIGHSCVIIVLMHLTKESCHSLDAQVQKLAR